MAKRFSVLIFLFFQLLFFSCSFFTSEKDSDLNYAFLLTQKSGTSFCLYGSVKTFKASNSSDSPKSAKKANSVSARTILPSFPTESLTYNVYALETGSDTKITPLTLDSSTGDYSIMIKDDGTYTFYAEVSDSNQKILYKGKTNPLTVLNGKITKNNVETETIDTIEAKPFQSDSGTGRAAIAIDVSSASTIKFIKAEWKKSGSEVSASYSSSGSSFTLHMSDESNSEKEISSGTYTLSIYFYADVSESTELYRITNETVQIYDNLTTNSCIGNASYFKGGKITITSSLISGTAYVAGTSATTLKTNPNGANGTYYAPYSSISDAVAKVTSSGSDTMTVYIDGTFDRAADGVLSLSVDSGKKLNIYGLDGADNSVITGSKGYGISVLSGSAVNLKDITVKSCAGGILNNGTLTLSGVKISGNTATGNGGGVYNRSALTVSDGTKIIGNKANYGGGIRMETNATLALGGNIEITGNTKSSDEKAADNVSLGTAAITVTSELSGTIGISLQNELPFGNTQTLTSGFGAKNQGTNPGSIFVADEEDSYKIEDAVSSSGEAVISRITTVWISSSGSDSNDGTYDSPFKTFGKAYQSFISAGISSSSANIIKIKDTLTPDAGLNSNDSVTATIQGATGADKTGKATIDLKNIKNESGSNGKNASGFYIAAVQNLTFKNLSFTTSGESPAYVYGVVFVDSDSANVIIEDCEFTGLNANGACSAISLGRGNLTLKNVKITGNKATIDSEGNGTRTYAVGFQGGTLTLSGTVTISDNTESDGKTPGNVYLGQGKKFTLSSDFSADSKVYFSAEDKPVSSAVTFATGYSLPATPSDIFTDDDGYIVSKEENSTNLVIKTTGNGNVKIAKPNLEFSADLSGSTYTIKAKSDETDVTSSVTNWSLEVASAGIVITETANFKVTATTESAPTVVLPDGLREGTYTIEISGTYNGVVYSDSISFQK